MALPVFIGLYNTLEAAMFYRSGADMRHFFFGGVQLLPNQQTPYIQTTNTSDGISITDYQVEVMSMCGNMLQDITNSFDVVDTFTDNQGQIQTVWSLSDIGYDAGYRLIYLRITTGIEAYVYSTPFYLTGFNSDYVSLWHYKQRQADTMMCVSLNAYYVCDADQQTLTNYTQVSTSQPYNYNSTVQYLELWRTAVIDLILFRKIKELFANKYRYLNYQFVNLSEAFDSPRPEQAENFGQAEFVVSRDSNNTYDPFYVPALPPTPEPTEKSIVLESIESIDNNRVKYYFTVNGFTPTYLTYQYSVDGITWVDATLGTGSPQTVQAPNNTTVNYYYRIWHYGENIYSNIIQVAVMSIDFINITSNSPAWSAGKAVDYEVQFSLNGFTVPAGGLITLEYSIDGITYGDESEALNASYTGLVALRFIPWPTAIQYTYFRIAYYANGVRSNVLRFELTAT